MAINIIIIIAIPLIKILFYIYSQIKGGLPARTPRNPISLLISFRKPPQDVCPTTLIPSPARKAGLVFFPNDGEDDGEEPPGPAKTRKLR